jgi:site-specific DNA-methyltransferase (adenine-specific)/modification methylase
MSSRVEHLADGVTLYCGDCREVLPTLGKVDAVVTDPPYGQRLKINQSPRNRVDVNGGKFFTQPHVYPPLFGDQEPFDPSIWLFAPEILLWGAHKFADRLPPGGWLVWDKVPTGKIRDQGDGEAAWINRDMPLRIFRLLWDGVCVGSAARHEITTGQRRYHPTQKPEALMLWCLKFIHGNIILDPFMGSGTTGVAVVKLGRCFTGIEIEPRYFDIACRRISDALARPDLFIKSPEPTESLEPLGKQETLL